MIDKAAVVLPQPLSPARPRLSPSPKVKSTPSTARTVPSCVWKWGLRPFTVRSGLLASDFEFTLVDVAFWVGLLVFQLPVGVVADRTPRRRTIVLSEVFRSAGILGYGISATFWGYVAANVVWSLGAAFSIGTSAYLYETLLEAGHESEFPRYIGRVTMIQLLSNAGGGLLGGVVVGVGGAPPRPLLGGALFALGAIGVAVTFREPKVERN